jgi:hypothetical protein
VRNFLWVLAIIGLNACQPVTVRHVDGHVPVAGSMDDAASWLEEWHRVIALPEDQLVATFKTRELEFERSANPETRLRLALLLAEGPQPVRDQVRALKLLKGLDAGQASDSARALAALLQQVIEEQRWSINKMAELNKKLEASQTNVDELELQLQELTTIEQNIQQRELPNSQKEQ